ncbi:unnamed protein product [Strongylus vulgaris]|uniref:Uncharacterized protein n=1 Tax=Strongylus vulgaris TaxID=40348 RepID=A0A3P7IQ97_STRVU|nr:unnamed protein product [Strongylus vulgaris]
MRTPEVVEIVMTQIEQKHRALWHINARAVKQTEGEPERLTHEVVIDVVVRCGADGEVTAWMTSGGMLESSRLVAQALS